MMTASIVQGHPIPQEAAMVDIVTCPHCGAVFRNRRFWALPKNDPAPRGRCPRCWRKGAFMVASADEVQAETKRMERNGWLLLIGEVAGLVGMMIWLVWR